MNGILLWLSCWLVSPALALAGPAVSVKLDHETATVGDVVTAQVWLRDFPVTEGGGVNVWFDPTVLHVTRVTVDSDDWAFASRTGITDNKVGLIRDIVFARFPGRAGDMQAAVVAFEAVGRGRCRLELAGSSLNPFGSGGQPIAASFDGASVLVRKAGSRKGAADPQGTE